MTLTISTNNNNDIYLGANGNLAMSSGIDAVSNACKNAALAQLGEMIFAINDGMPNFQVVWKGAPNLPLFSSYLRDVLQGVSGVQQIESVAVYQDGDVLKYTATILTDFGVRQLNGNL